MKVKDLIKQLEVLDQDLEVVINGYEGGYNNVEGITEVRKFNLNVNLNTWYYGKHELVNEYCIGEYEHFDAVTIF